MTLRVLELFGGIGACSKALERLGADFEIADYIEIDKYAVKSFNAIHGTNFEPQDITEWDKSIEVDLIMHGSPCQDFSIAGKQAGGDKGSGNRSSLMYETIRIVENLKPKYVIWENVKNILSEKHRHNFEAYCRRMIELGYKNFVQVLNAKDYNVPQNRERVFTVSISRTTEDGNPKFNFPEKQPLDKCLKDVLEDDVDEKYYLSPQQVASILGSSYERYKRFYSPDGISPSLDTMSGENRQPKVAIKTANATGYDLAEDGDGIDLAYPNSKTRRGRVGHGIAKTIETSPTMGCLCARRIRKLTPKECWRLMGFDDSDFKKVTQVCSNTQLYKQAGNSIVVNVLEAVLDNLLN